MDLSSIDIQNIEAEWLIDSQISLDILRLDKIHPVVSGNKWFKLKYYINEATKTGSDALATFGGAWSNHIVAAAFMAKEAGLKSVGIIRGEKPRALSATLNVAVDYGMELHFVSREQYRRKDEIREAFLPRNLYWVDEGGFGIKGVKGAAEILSTFKCSKYSHILAAVGTGTMLAGLTLGISKQQKVIGISAMKGNYSVEQKILELTGMQANEALFEIQHDYHFGGYGKHPESLISFINDSYTKHQLPLDIIYTGKTFFAIKDLVKKKHFEQGSRLLMIHNGGLQGNKSLPAKVLAF